MDENINSWNDEPEKKKQVLPEHTSANHPLATISRLKIKPNAEFSGLSHSTLLAVAAVQEQFLKKASGFTT